MDKKYVCERAFTVGATARRFKVGQSCPASIVESHNLLKQGVVKIDRTKSNSSKEDQENGIET